MELISEKKRLITNRVGRIMGVDVNFNFEQNIGEAPSTVNANCSIPGATPESGSCNITINRQTNGQKSIAINGNKNIVELYPVIEEIEAELEIIAVEGVVA
ncbi:MAG TPA: hypothetical protein VFC67_16060 [Prolixibacteraceae bacterium]|nr:hypothetical protein [Prolixibacteraceae bacterium]